MSLAHELRREYKAMDSDDEDDNVLKNLHEVSQPSHLCTDIGGGRGNDGGSDIAGGDVDGDGASRRINY
jgi:hypothetical protein